MQERLEVIIIGAGQAGLAMGYYLKKQQRSFLILDGAPRIGDSWRARYDSLRLFTPTQYHLPGLPFPGGVGQYPTKDEVADYLETYAQTSGLPVQLNTPVRSVAQADRGYRVESGEQVYCADQVVIATGPFQRPFVPALNSRLAPEIYQVHSSAYRSPAELPPGPVLVVGGGNSGVQIAEELARTHRVYLSEGSRKPAVPQQILGRDLFWWLSRAGIMKITADSAIGQRLSQKDLLIGTSLTRLVQRYKVELLGRAEQAQGRTIRFAGGRSIQVESVIWATGFRSDYSWVHLPVFDQRGVPRHRRGVTDSPGLYFLGLQWQHTRGSALLGWIGQDAEYLAACIEKAWS